MAIGGLYYIHIAASDLARSKRFYGEVLGWQLGTDETGVAGFSFGTGYLVVTQDSRPEAERVYGGGMFACVNVDDIEAQHARLLAAGVEASPDETKPWGEKSFGFADPDGYFWQYGQ